MIRLMINDPTILRFIEKDEASPEIGLEEISGVSRSLAHAFSEVLRTIGDGNVRLLLVASPRLGSLELLLRPEINISFEIVSVLASIPADEEGFLERLAEAATVGTFAIELWRVVFGADGIFDRWKRDQPARTGLQVMLSVTDRALQNGQVREAFKGLVTSALRSGADRVEIDIGDSRPVVLASRRERRGFSKAALKYKRAEQRRNPTRISRGNGEPAARARYNGVEYTSFLATPADGSPSIVVLWGSTLPIPKGGDAVDVQAMVIDDPEQVEFLEEAPLAFEDAEFVVVVSRAKRDWE